MQSYVLRLPHWHRIITGWLTKQTICNSSNVTLNLFTTFLFVRAYKSYIQMAKLRVFHFVLVRWANFTTVKILYKAYPSSHNTAKCKKGPSHRVIRDFSPLSFSPFSLWCTIKGAKECPLVYKMQITQNDNILAVCLCDDLKEYFCFPFCCRGN